MHTYSILGVSPGCPQEQIKKHYKKIAVLVHPDKNKQAGAEEAFKVLQRSFELIGELVSFEFYSFYSLSILYLRNLTH
jgi:curved DNA-binding protein CbpA